MTVNVIVVYPNEEDATFDMKYYLDSHMPMVLEKFKQFGMQGYSVLQFQPGPDGAKPRFSVQAILAFDKAESWGAAVQGEGPAVFGDVPNFSNKQPTAMVGEVLADKS